MKWQMRSFESFMIIHLQRSEALKTIKDGCSLENGERRGGAII